MCSTGKLVLGRMRCVDKKIWVVLVVGIVCWLIV